MSNIKKKLKAIEAELAARRLYKETQRVIYLYEGNQCFFHPRKGFTPVPRLVAEGKDKVGRLTVVGVDPLRLIGVVKEQEIPDAKPISAENDLLSMPEEKEDDGTGILQSGQPGSNS